MNYDNPRYTRFSCNQFVNFTIKYEAKNMTPTTPREERITRDSSDVSPEWENLLNCPALARGAKRLGFLTVAYLVIERYGNGEEARVTVAYKGRMGSANCISRDCMT